MLRVTASHSLPDDGAGPEARWLGIDFSGSPAMWRAAARRTNVWLAEVAEDRGRLALTSLRAVTELPGDDPPFARLVALLRRGDHRVVGVDAPLGVPRELLPRGGVGALAARIAQTPRGDARPAPFCAGRDVVELLLPADAPRGRKLLRPCEQLWRAQGLNPRSALWAGPRGGAGLLAAALTLVHRAGCSVWPTRAGAGTVVAEVYPTAQLRTWGLPHQAYGTESAAAVDLRGRLVDAVGARCELGAHAARMVASADALDSVLCALGAFAADRGPLAEPIPAAGVDDGWIAVLGPQVGAG